MEISADSQHSFVVHLEPVISFKIIAYPAISFVWRLFVDGLDGIFDRNIYLLAFRRNSVYPFVI
jgi:hypothetical protein